MEEKVKIKICGLRTKEDAAAVMFPGWEENGTPVEWFYTATIGRHILEPLESVPLDEKYTVELELQWMSDDYEVGDQYVNLCYLQTLTDYAASETDDSHEELLKNCPAYRDIYDSQMGKEDLHG